MVDVGFWEMVMVGVVALIVVGPERLPGLARTVGLWLGRTRYFVSSVKAEIDREIRADALRRMLEEQARVPEVYDLIEETRQHLADVHEAIHSPLEATQLALPLSDAPPAPPPVVAETEALDHVPEEFRGAFSGEETVRVDHP